MTKKILMNSGEAILVDNEDYPIVSRYSRRKVSQKGYAATTIIFADLTERTLYMHQLILATNRQVDHKNGNHLDNRKDNLRQATYQQNGWNKGKYVRKDRPCTSKYKGVSYRPLRGKPRWLAMLKHVEQGKDKSTGKMVYIGYYATEREAALAYDKKVLELRGKWAWTNILKNNEAQVG